MNSTENLITETNVLRSLMTCIAKAAPCDLALVEPVFDQQLPSDPESWLRYVAMAKLLGREVGAPELEPSEEATSRLFIRTARAWMFWATRRPDEAKTALNGTVCSAPSREAGGEIHMMALGAWCHGVGALLREDREEALRYFRRATEIGSQLGTETNTAIQWAYVATFFEHGGPTS